MGQNWKQGLKLMWGSKCLRLFFGSGIGFAGNMFFFGMTAIAMAAPSIFLIFGKNLWESDLYRWAYLCAFLCKCIMDMLVTECALIYNKSSGKGIAGMPVSKWVLTKGLVMNKLVFYEIGFVIMMGIHGINVAVGAVASDVTDDLLVLTVVMFFIDALIQMLIGYFDRYNKGTHYSGVYVALLILVPRALGKIGLSVEMALLIQCLCVLGGLVMYYLHFLCKYKRRVYLSKPATNSLGTR
ncbi:MAG: hypothetical protein IJZ55_10085 [Lachnospiraceae bacterium]|nr:hypothetical protein [Lachnospiraceae bacterium]